jgi:hypothetical protein
MTMVAGQQKVVNPNDKQGGALVPAGAPHKPAQAKKR